MIEIQQLSKRYGDFQALDKCSAYFVSGEVVAVIGPNAAGKTTLIKCILGMVRPDKGQILFENQVIGTDWRYRKKIGYMPQITRFPENLTIAALFELMLDLREITDKNALDWSLYEAFALDAIENKLLRTLSGGTRQKVSAALAFLFQPIVLFLDEPTAGLDPIAADIFLTRIEKAKTEGKLTIITSHLMNEVEKLADRAMYLQDGQIQFFATPENLRQTSGETDLMRAIAWQLRSNDEIQR
jgi:Cu-processing system ATP-binding protein